MSFVISNNQVCLMKCVALYNIQNLQHHVVVTVATIPYTYQYHIAMVTIAGTPWQHSNLMPHSQFHAKQSI